ncbi:hypothetical protein RvY_15493 [Ramazzottius varieornatus]|uniref:Uncharacterized protein n=1 Tax=Ramazzottius varieornatus TaxID=947166 RepID=A0A1D1VV39_RAMVA|nr:hypothetical protein RvY_15493 [Ramazzottius varieornatus]
MHGDGAGTSITYTSDPRHSINSLQKPATALKVPTTTALLIEDRQRGTLSYKVRDTNLASKTESTAAFTSSFSQDHSRVSG